MYSVDFVDYEEDVDYDSAHVVEPADKPSPSQPQLQPKPKPVALSTIKDARTLVEVINKDYEAVMSDLTDKDVHHIIKLLTKGPIKTSFLALLVRGQMK